MSNTFAWPAIVVAIIGAFLVTLITASVVAPNDVTVPTAEEIAAKVKVAPSYNYNDSALVFKLNNLETKVTDVSNEVLKEDLREVKAQELVLDELKSKDFKRELREFLNSELNESGSSSRVEDYKDVKSVTVLDEEYTVSGHSVSVDLVLKVKYALDGDDDVDDVESAKVSVELHVSDVDEDEGYEDAEVDSYSVDDFTLKRFYD